MSVTLDPRSTTDPPLNASATWRTSPRSTQSAMSPQNPITGPGRLFTSSGTTVAGSNARAKCARSTPCWTSQAFGLNRSLSLRSFSAEQITTSALARRRRSSSRICWPGASENALNSSTQW